MSQTDDALGLTMRDWQNADLHRPYRPNRPSAPRSPPLCRGCQLTGRPPHLADTSDPCQRPIVMARKASQNEQATPTRQLITPRYAPTTGSGIRAVRCGLSELTQRGTKLPKATYIGTTALEDIVADPTHHIPYQSNDTSVRTRSSLDVGRRYCSCQHMSKLQPVRVAAYICNSIQTQGLLGDTKSHHRGKK